MCATMCVCYVYTCMYVHIYSVTSMLVLVTHPLAPTLGVVRRGGWGEGVGVGVVHPVGCETMG